MSQFPYTLSDRSCTVLVNGRPYQTDRSNPNWDRIKEALNNPDTTEDEMIALLSPVHAIAHATTGTRITVRDGQVYYGNEVIHNALAVRILDIIGEGLNVDPWIKFAENVYANPLPWARNELYDFLSKSDLPITPDGCFIAYKIVRDDYTDVYSGTIDNSIGRIVSMPRERVDTDRYNHCSTGLHFCSKGYLPYFGTGTSGRRVLLLKINPADVVSIPTDYNYAKGRTWRYEVVGEIDYDEALECNWSPISSSYTPPDSDQTHRWGYDETEPEPEDDDITVDDLPEDDEEDFPEDDEEDIELPVLATIADDPLIDLSGPMPEPGTEQKPRAYVDTVALGRITKAKFRKLLKEHGSLSGIARHTGVSSGTVQAWKTKLFGKAND